MDHNKLYQEAHELIQISQPEKALEICLEQIEKAPNNSLEKAQWLSKAGDVFKANDEYDKSLEYYHKAHKINLLKNDTLYLLNDNVRIGQIFQRKVNDLYDSLYLKKTLKLKDSALFYYNKNIVDYKSYNESYYKAFTLQ